MTYSFKEFEGAIVDIVSWLGKEYSGIRTGRATPALLDSVRVDSYGARVPLQQIGSVGVEDARTIRIAPWDPNQTKDIERAIIEADLGISVAIDQKGLRVSFPELTSERRVQLQRLAKTKLEEARVSVRKRRDETIKDIDAKEKEGDMSEDDKFRAKEDLQKRVDTANHQLDEMFSAKEKEIGE